jgi:hypothetical protein
MAVPVMAVLTTVQVGAEVQAVVAGVAFQMPITSEVLEHRVKEIMVVRVFGTLTTQVKV